MVLSCISRLRIGKRRRCTSRLTRIRIGILLTGGLHLGGEVSLPAQQHPARFIRWEASAIAPTAPGAWPTRGRDSASLEDYRYEGLAFGGVVFGALGVWIGSRISGSCALEPGTPCGSDKVGQAVALGLAGAAIGGGLGYLVGRFSPKRPSPHFPGTGLPSGDLVSVPDSVRKRTGDQHWRGSAIGLAIGGAVGALTGAILGGISECSDCSRQPTAGNGALTLGLVGAGAGGVLGFLAGLASPKYVWIPRGRRTSPAE